MSYSRWSNSRWYTFWCAWSENDLKTKGKCIFSVDCRFHFTYDQLKASIDDCIKQVCDWYAAQHEETWGGCLGTEKIDVTVGGDPVEIEDQLELRSYMEEFMRDVEEEYATNKCGPDCTCDDLGTCSCGREDDIDTEAETKILPGTAADDGEER